MTSTPWPAIALAQRRDGPPRIPFLLAEGGLEFVLGSVAVSHLPALARWPDAFELVEGKTLWLRLPPSERDERLAAIHRQLHADGLIVGWRDEPYALRDRDGGEHATIERAASRFWGTLTCGAHCNGYVADAAGRPTHLWIARRADTKPTDPGRLDNMIGGGVPRQQSPREAVIREGWEEAGLEPAQMSLLTEGGRIDLECDVPEGRQHERLFVFDLALSPDVVPRAVDGEVAEHRLMPLSEALARAAAGELTTDAALATLDFALRRGLLESTLSEASLRAFQQLQASAGGTMREGRR